MIDFERHDDAASGFALFPTRSTLLAEPALTIQALFRRAYAWAPASHQANPQTIASTMAMEASIAK
ncbi:hypothetical protein ACFSQT_11965 [Mesorhizobium calcicola]|uniref:Uncharacterized protein n=1 Tax=Mesorhizobium calcicola TaxID=1300310 RepID=A0ABW4WE72_9HYPH